MTLAPAKPSPFERGGVFEYAVSAGEGTLVAHDKNADFVELTCLVAKASRQGHTVIFERIA